jgi:hypothetical protein
VKNETETNNFCLSLIEICIRLYSKSFPMFTRSMSIFISSVSFCSDDPEGDFCQFPGASRSSAVANLSIGTPSEMLIPLILTVVLFSGFKHYYHRSLTHYRYHIMPVSSISSDPTAFTTENARRLSRYRSARVIGDPLMRGNKYG